MRPSVSYSIALGLFLLDFATKRIVLANQEIFSRGIPLLDGLLRFTYVRNAGAAFGILQGGRWPFVVVSMLAVLGLAWILRRGAQRSSLRSVAYSMILGGAAGNLVDRVFYGGRVVDFIEMGWRGHIFPVYNVADMGVSIGAALLILALMREGDHKSEEPLADQFHAGVSGTESGQDPVLEGARDEPAPPNA